jgi:ATP/maltotriose-dependent transcriptional regulator MalT
VSAQLAELEAILRQLTLAALKLPPGDERRDALTGIDNFRQRLLLKQVAIAPRREHKEIASTKNVLSALTARERQIMQLVSEGLSNKEIGRRLNIVDGTIKVHLHNIFQKLHVNNRTVLAGLATRLPSAVSEPPECIDPLAGDDGDGVNEQ